MIENNLHIALVYQEPIIPSEVVSGFEDDIKAPKLNVKVEPVPMMGARAGVEWLLPTAIVAYIAKPYFESFLSEMGKDQAFLECILLNCSGTSSPVIADR